MGNTETPMEKLFERAENYSKTIIELFKLNVIDKSADVISTLMSQIVAIIIMAMFILTLSVAVALWLGEVLGKSYYGFFAVTGFYGLVALLICAFRIAFIKIPINNSIVKEMLKQGKI